METAEQQSALAKALQSLKSLQDANRVFAIHGSEVLGTSNTSVLVENGFLEPVIRGWYIPSNPSHAGTTVTWYASYWGFIATYCNDRFGDDWCLTPEESISVLSGVSIIPQQVIVKVLKGSNTPQQLLHGTSILNITAKLPSRIDTEPTYGLHVYPLAEALLRCSPDFYLNHPTETRACLNALEDGEELASIIRDAGGEAYAGRLLGALRAVGREDAAETIYNVLRDTGRRIEETNPFMRTFEPLPPLAHSTIAARLRILWADMRQQILTSLPTDNPQPKLRPLAEILKDIDERYVADSYHSLSIEGYKISEDLIRRVRDGKWDPKANPDDQDQKNALVASGYYRAYQKVRSAIESIVNGADAGTVIANGITDWHRELFLPCVDAGIITTSDLAGYRHGPVYIAGSRYTPPSADMLSDSMEALFDLIRSERDYRVRAILGHFFFVNIHPYPDGNGRTARFIMNAALVAGGGQWTVIPVESREHYMRSLETASVEGNILDFVSVVLNSRSEKAASAAF